MQHRQKYGPFDGELEVALLYQFAQDGIDAALAPEAAEAV